MNTNRLLIADPYDNYHIRLFDDFENDNNNNNKPITTYLTGIQRAYEKNAFTEINRNSNDFNIIVFTMHENEDAIKDYCYIKGEKDRKVCELFFAHLKDKRKMRPIMDKVSDYVLNGMGMEQVFVSITDDEKLLANQLYEHGFENIGEVEGTTKFIKEKEEVKEMSKMI